MSYRKDYNKIVNKINSIALKGKSGIYDYYSYIDELIENSQYSIFEDVLLSKYKINVKIYKTVQDIKKQTFNLIREGTKSSFQVKLKKLFDTNNIYQMGFKFYDSTNNNYLGDIKEVEEKRNWIVYRDPELAEKEDQISVINLEIVKGITQSFIVDDTIPLYDKYKQSIVIIKS
jgi:hypothetical protein